MLRVVSINGADELQIVRIITAQLISFAFVLAIYHHNKQTQKYTDTFLIRTKRDKLA